MIIARAGAADAGAVADVYLRARAAAGAAMPPGVHPDDEVRGYVADVLIPEHEVWLARLDDAPAGVLVLAGDDLHWLFVAPQAQRRGVGTALRGFVEVGRTDGAGNEERAPDIRLVWGAHPEGVSPAGGP
jgi:GNAT superfamily N-acetyltransferase